MSGSNYRNLTDQSMPRSNWLAGIAAVVAFFALTHMASCSCESPVACTTEAQL